MRSTSPKPAKRRPASRSVVSEKRSRVTADPGKTSVTIGSRTLTLSNLDKVLYPDAGFTKGQVIDYYARVARVLLPHLGDRPLTLKRYPDGVEGPFFYEKRCPRFRPTWLKTAPIWSERQQENISFCLANDLESLIWAANLADLELHTSLARYQHPERPTVMVFDLDPAPGVDVLGCAEVAFWLKDWLEANDLESFIKTSGSKGLQLYVPLNTTATFDQTKSLAHQAADELTAKHPDRVVATMTKRLRAGKVFIDWSQNDAHKTTVCVYSLRAKAMPTVSTPLRWREVKEALSGPASNLSFTAEELLKRVDKLGDLFEPVLSRKQKLPR